MKLYQDEHGRACVSFPGAKGTMTIRCKSGVSVARLSESLHAQPGKWNTYTRGKVRFETARKALLEAGVA
jgi:hypothetical protein